MSDPPACSAFDLRQRFLIPHLSLARAAFRPAQGQCNRRFLKGLAPAGAGNLRRPFTRPQRRLRHHCEVSAPGLPVRIRTENCRQPVPSPALRRVTRCSQPFPALPLALLTPLHFGHPREQVPSRPPDQSVRTATSSGKLASQNARLSLAPRCALVRLRVGSKLETRFVPLGYRSVNSGTEIIMTPSDESVNSIIDVFDEFPQLFQSIIFNKLKACQSGFRVHKPAVNVFVRRTVRRWLISTTGWWLMIGPQRPGHHCFLIDSDR